MRVIVLHGDARRNFGIAALLVLVGVGGLIFSAVQDFFYLAIVMVTAIMVGSFICFRIMWVERPDGRKGRVFYLVSLVAGFFLVLFLLDVPAYRNHDYEVASGIPSKVEHGKRSNVYVTVEGHQFTYDERELPINPYDYRFEIHYLPWTRWRVDSSITIATR
ncbi:hypothetical protein JJB07_04870 [Tumebacillus sp. ITR2]|uniref:DUF4131 domain-containing protein n=1 Tax=Tumebacillus amylolyticus TaxID=2801339 RepID=A0ABS1J8K1_9BACL|nr:hypothetical protein [Tumebacillus amylolyticus]MBL0385978.1 hypothetical protein [Tumebacillus amylolyticus]